MFLTQFPWVATFLLYVLSSGFLTVEAQDSDPFSKKTNSSSTQQVHLILEHDPMNEPEKKTQSASKAAPLSEQDLLIAELIRERDQALIKAQEAEAKVSKQAKQMDELKAGSNPTAQATTSIPSPVVSDIAIPEIAKGYENIYKRFLGGKLIYTDPNSKAKTELPIRALANPLEGTFDLSGCGDTGKYLSIATGYKKGLKAENSNKVEIWITPRFLVEKELATTAQHLQHIMGWWDENEAPIGLFWAWGAWGQGQMHWFNQERMCFHCAGKHSLHGHGVRGPGPEWRPESDVIATDTSSAAFTFIF